MAWMWFLKSVPKEQRWVSPRLPLSSKTVVPCDHTPEAQAATLALLSRTTRRNALSPYHSLHLVINYPAIMELCSTLTHDDVDETFHYNPSLFTLSFVLKRVKVRQSRRLQCGATPSSAGHTVEREQLPERHYSVSLFFGFLGVFSIFSRPFLFRFFFFDFLTGTSVSPC